MNYEDLKKYVQNITSLQTTGGTNDLYMIEAALNEAYLQAVVQSKALTGTMTVNLTPGTDEYDLNTVSPDVLEILSVYKVNNGHNTPMNRSSVASIQSARLSGHGGSVNSYSVLGSNLLWLYPKPNTSDVLTIVYVKAPKKLGSVNDSTTETTPSSIPVQFHISIIANLAVAMILEYERTANVERAAYYRSLANDAMKDLISYSQMRGGELPDNKIGIF